MRDLIRLRGFVLGNQVEIDVTMKYLKQLVLLIATTAASAQGLNSYH